MKWWSSDWRGELLGGRPGTRWRRIVLLRNCGLLFAVVVNPLMIFPITLRHGSAWWMAALPVLQFTVVVVMMMGFLRARKRLWRGLTARGFLVCNECEYELRADREAGVCPECGAGYTRAGLMTRWCERLGQSRFDIPREYRERSVARPPDEGGQR